jgi:hypothetical protein
MHALHVYSLCLLAGAALCIPLPRETDVLHEFFVATGGPNWLVNSGWLPGTRPHCEWTGVVCNSDSIVT